MSCDWLNRKTPIKSKTCVSQKLTKTTRVLLTAKQTNTRHFRNFVRFSRRIHNKTFEFFGGGEEQFISVSEFKKIKVYSEMGSNCLSQQGERRNSREKMSTELCHLWCRAFEYPKQKIHTVRENVNHPSSGKTHWFLKRPRSFKDLDRSKKNILPICLPLSPAKAYRVLFMRDIRRCKNMFGPWFCWVVRTFVNP